MDLGPIIDSIERYLDGHSSRNMRTLARRSGVSYATIRRLMQRETTSPSVETTILPILSVFMDNKEIYSILRKCRLEFSSFIQPFVSYDTQSSFRYTPVDQQILALASRSEGYTLDHLSNDIGQKGLERVEVLYEANLLERHDDRVYARNVLLSDPEDIKDNIVNGVHNFDPSHIDKGSYYHHFHGAIPKKYFALLKQKQQEYVELLNEALEVGQEDKSIEQIGVSVSVVGDFFEGKEN
ncbi:hypothetical protein [Pseudobacteriovorax antillogorgiicola]|uniref:Uncharacterized protein n=1 Tax=Pseudobacteriovorax antillogorgiicola TaxID=1513793 RepID=A0A1Y6BXL6_9BACT|nr:hypothetical protein [Pseudobacteriovorax antillogorgiicola]TCS43383.1 hypothetical protein EDD56_13723 [Pseudobacteriovorax antillogorgiicola]SMF34956.1 hypothetical protein SAMN06296036_110185 [Pseudobacteriovorax antillogorgiicola]